MAKGGVVMKYISPQEASKRWGYAEGTIRKWCKDGLLSVVCHPVKESGRWKIPANAECPKPIKIKK